MYKVLTKQGLKYTDGQSIKNRTNFKGWYCKQTNYIIDAAWWEVGTSVCRTPYPVSIDDYTGPKEIICPDDNCFCGTDIAMPKGKTEDHLLMIPFLQVSDKLKPEDAEIQKILNQCRRLKQANEDFTLLEIINAVNLHKNSKKIINAITTISDILEQVQIVETIHTATADIKSGREMISKLGDLANSFADIEEKRTNSPYPYIDKE